MKTDWHEAIKPLLDKYRGKPHPLESNNPYQLVVMVILSANDSDRNINQLALTLFKAFRCGGALSCHQRRQTQNIVNGVMKNACAYYRGATYRT